ncbi:hypothetical protein ACN28S_07880 [Cystobacter fuscus]
MCLLRLREWEDASDDQLEPTLAKSRDDLVRAGLPSWPAQLAPARGPPLRAWC